MTEDEKFPCGPCTIAILLGELKDICEGQGNSQEKCELKIKNVFAGKTNIVDLVRETEKTITTDDERATLEAVKIVLREMKIL